MHTFIDSAKELLGSSPYGVPITSWLNMLAATVVLSAIFILLKKAIAWRLRAFSKKTRTPIDDAIYEVVQQTRAYFLVSLALYVSVRVLVAEVPVVEFVGRVVFLVLLVQVIRWGNDLIVMYVRRYRERRLEEDAAAVTTVQAMGFLAKLAVWAVVLLLALDNFGVDITALVAGLGVGGIAVALALQNILGDLFASLSIVLDKPFVVGDFLIIGDYLGTVEQIGLKTTRLRSLSGEQIVVSNSDLLNSRIRNYKRMFERRVVFSFGVLYQTPQDKLAAIPEMVREIITECERVRFDRAHFKEFGASALNFEVVYYVLVPDYNVYMDIQQAINLALRARFQEQRIDFAYPTQTVYVEKGDGGDGLS